MGKGKYMKLCIVGPEKRTKTELKLIESGKKIFNSVLYIPYSNIPLLIDDEVKISYKNVDITKFDAILPRIPRKGSFFGYLLLNMLKIYSPVKAQAFLMSSNRFWMMNILKKEGINVPKIFFINSSSGFNLLKSGRLNFPIFLRMANRLKDVTIANNPKEAKTILDTFKKFKSPAYIEEFCKKKFIQVFVIGNSVAAAVERNPKRKVDVLFDGGQLRKTKISRKNEILAVTAAKALKTDFAMVKIMDEKVIDVNLCPPISIAEEITDVNISEKLLEYIKDKAIIEKKPISWFSRFFEELRYSIKDVFD